MCNSVGGSKVNVYYRIQPTAFFLCNDVICTSNYAASNGTIISEWNGMHVDRLCGLVVRVPGYRSWGPGFDSGTGSTQPREDNWGATWNESGG
jgi:hypothetical protein